MGKRKVSLPASTAARRAAQSSATSSKRTPTLSRCSHTVTREPKPTRLVKRPFALALKLALCEPVFPDRFTDFAVVITSEKVENGAFESDPSIWKRVGNSIALPIR